MASQADEQMCGLAALAVPLLGLTAMLTLVTGGAEAWRYALLLDSRFDAVPAGPLHAGDALVVTGGVVSLLSAFLAGAVTLGWVVHASTAAARYSAVAPTRRRWQLVLGVPDAGAESGGAGRGARRAGTCRAGPGYGPPTAPFGLVIGWWVVWATGLVLAGTALLWNLRQGVQARADGVLLHVVTDLVGGVLAVTTIVVVQRLTRLLSPTKLAGARRMVVVRVSGGPGCPGPAKQVLGWSYGTPRLRDTVPP